MSFETTCTFLTRAAQEGLGDNLMSPSARIVTGSVPKGGTGAFELLLPLTGLVTAQGGQSINYTDCDMAMEE
jgi:hypothetical protein